MFDPEKVAHYQPLNWDTGMYPEPSDKSAQYVLATDYDQLLEIYRAEVDKMRPRGSEETVNRGMGFIGTPSSYVP